MVVFGGKKPSDKFAVIGNLLGLADRILIGGGMGYTFLAGEGARGRPLGARGGPDPSGADLLAMTACAGPTMTGRFLAVVATPEGFGGCDGAAGTGCVAAGGEA